MTPRSARLVLGAMAAAGAVALAVAAPRAVRAASTAERAVTRFQQTRTAVAELAALRAARPAPPAGAEAPKLAPAVSGALAAAGLPAQALSSLSPESAALERVGADVGLVRRRATVVLTPLTLPQLGRFLDAWRQRSPEWTIARIDLEPRREAQPVPGTDSPLRASLVLEQVELDNTPPTTRR